MRKAKIYYARMDEFWLKEEKLSCLEKFENLQDVDWQEIQPNTKYVWLTEGFEDDFDSFIALGSKEAKASKVEVTDCIFKVFSNGVKTNRDLWVYSFTSNDLSENIKTTIEAYNIQVSRWNQQESKSFNIDDFIIYDDTKISWSSTLKTWLKRCTLHKFNSSQIRSALSRPFCKQFLYFDEILNDRRGLFPLIYPNHKSEVENLIISVPGAGGRTEFWSFISNLITNLSLTSIDQTQCFPFYIYDEDETNRQENITDWALEQFQTHYQDLKITKWDIFHYTYALLHHPHYRQRYAANLKRELPRIPFARPMKS